MIDRVERIAAVGLAAFIAQSAVAGGAGLVGGGLPFPLDWPAGTPFGSYPVPALILALEVGGAPSPPPARCFASTSSPRWRPSAPGWSRSAGSSARSSWSARAAA